MAQPVTPSTENSSAEQPETRPVSEQPGRRGPAETPARPAQPGAYPGAPGTGRPGGSGPRRPRRTWIWIVAAVVVAGLVVYLLIPHGGGGQGAGAAGGRGGRGGAGRAGGPPTSVNVAKVVQGDVPIYLDAIGTVTPVATVTVRPQIAGQITRIGFEEGQMVRKGQFLIEIDPRQPQQALLQAQGALARDQANLQNARLLLQRDQTLLTQDSIARQDVDNQLATVRQLEATIRTDDAAVGQARLNLSYTHITAPVAGRVGLRQVDVGNYVTVGQTAGTTTQANVTQSTGLVVITQITPIDVLFSVPEDNLPQVSARIRSGASLPVTAFDRSQTTQLAQGRLLTLDNLVDTATGTVKAKARFANTDGALYPNQFVNARVLVDTVHGALTVPSSAVLRGANGLFVYVVQPGRKVAVRNIQTGPTAGQVTAVTAGLQLGETVVTDGSDRLRDGATVMLPGDCPPAGGRGGRGGQAGSGGGQGGRQAQGQRGAGQRGGAGGFAGCRPGAGQGGGGQGGQGQGPASGGAAPAGSAASSGGPPQAGGGALGGGARSAAGGAAAPSQVRGSAGTQSPAGAVGQGGGGQGGGGQGGGGQGGGGPMRLLGQLNLTAQQQAKVDPILQEARQTAASSDDPDARRQAFQGAMQRIMPILTPEQRTKLQELRSQGGGGRGAGFGGGGAPDGGAGQP